MKTRTSIWWGPAILVALGLFGGARLLVTDQTTRLDAARSHAARYQAHCQAMRDLVGQLEHDLVDGTGPEVDSMVTTFDGVDANVHEDVKHKLFAATGARYERAVKTFARLNSSMWRETSLCTPDETSLDEFCIDNNTPCVRFVTARAVIWLAIGSISASARYHVEDDHE